MIIKIILLRVKETAVAVAPSLAPVFDWGLDSTQSIEKLNSRTDLHLARKLWHMCMGVTASMIYLSGMSRGVALVVVGTLLGLDLLIETARLRSSWVNEVVMRLWAPVMRKGEVHQLSGITYYLASLLLVVAIFPKPIAALAILYLACGDPIASLFGIRLGHYGPRYKNGKSLIGSAAGVVTCAFITFLILHAIELLSLNDFRLWVLTAVGAFAGGLAELVPIDVDDNFLIPTVSGFALWLTFILLGV